jgi:hypothetical protein
MKQIDSKQRTALSKFRALTSLNQICCQTLLPVFDCHVVAHLSVYTLKGKVRLLLSFKEAVNSSLYGSVSKLDFMLLYLKENPTQSYHGCLFELSQAKVSEWLKLLLPLLGNVVERSIPRSTCRHTQKDEYSGKKKQHTHKNFAIADPNGQVLFLSETYEGSVHDKTVWNEIKFDIEEHTLLLDSGFEGAEHQCPTVVTPFKKPKGKELTDSKKTSTRASARKKPSSRTSSR